MPTISGVAQPTRTFFKRVSHELSPSQLKTLPRRISLGVKHQVKDEPLILWMGMTGLPAAILTPFTLNWDLRHKPQISRDERHLLTYQEIIRQMVSAITYWLGYYGGIIITGLGLKANSSHRSVKQLIGGTLLATVGTGIVRPIITNAFLAKHVGQDKQQNPFAKPLISA